MRFLPKSKRNAVKRRTNIDFDDYAFDANADFVSGTWYLLTVLSAKEKLTKNDDDMWAVQFGVDLPGYDGGGRVMWHVPETFAPKVEQLQTALLPEFEDEDEAFDIKPSKIMFRTAAGLIEEDKDFQRDDGQTSWQVTKVMKLEDAVEAGLLVLEDQDVSDDDVSDDGDESDDDEDNAAAPADEPAEELAF